MGNFSFGMLLSQKKLLENLATKKKFVKIWAFNFLIFYFFMKILIAEDDALLCKAYKKMFSNATGMPENVFMAKNGKEAIEIIEKESPQLILLDLMMPEVDGFGVLEHLNKDGKIDGTTVFVLTNLSNDSDREKAMGLGATDFIIKSNITTKMVKNLLPS